MGIFNIPEITIPADTNVVETIQVLTTPQGDILNEKTANEIINSAVGDYISKSPIGFLFGNNGQNFKPTEDAIMPMFRLTFLVTELDKNGEPVDKDVPLEGWVYKHITRVKYTESADDGAVDTFKIDIEDPECQVVNENLFVEKQTIIRCEMGYAKEKKNQTLFIGRVEEVVNDYPTSGCITLSITAKTFAYGMNQSEVTREWKGMTYHQVVEEICLNYGYECESDSTEYIKPISPDNVINQMNETDLAFIQRLCKGCGYHFIMDSATMKAYFKQPIHLINMPTVFVQYKCGNQQLRSFRPKYNDYDKAQNIVATNINIAHNRIVGGKFYS